MSFVQDYTKLYSLFEIKFCFVFRSVLQNNKPRHTPFKDKTYTHTFAGYNNLLDSPYLNMALQIAEPSANIVAKISHNVSHL